jgi:hypothetical protein
MSGSEMQACLAQLYTQDAYRALFAIHPDRCLSSYRLTQEETNALKALNLSELDRFAATLRAKRRGKLRSGFPLLFALEPTIIGQLADRYMELHPARPHETTLQQVLSFGEYIEEAIDGDAQLPNYACDLARYELLYFTAKFQPIAIDEPPAWTTRPTGGGFRLLGNVRPRRGAGTFIGTFQVDIQEVALLTQQGNPPRFAPPDVTHLLFQQQPAEVDPLLFALNVLTVELLDLCDGSRCIDAIIDAVEEAVGESPLDDEVMTMVEQFVQAGIVGV